MSNVLMTVVGTGIYRECTYKMEGAALQKDKLIQKALCKMLKEKGEDFDRIVCFMTEGTEGSKALNWEEYKRKDRGTGEFIVDNKEGGLKPFFEKEFPDTEIEPVIIPFSQSEEEILSTFQIMYDSIREGDRITLDVTHGFRIMPMLFFPLLQYAKELKNISVKAIYYGAFEADGDEKPVINLVMYNDILDWANAAHGFVKFGNSGDMEKLTQDLNRNAMTEKKDGRYQKVNGVVKAMKNFTMAIQTCRGSNAGKAGIMKKYKVLMDGYSKMDKKTEYSPLDELLDYAVESVRSFQDKDLVASGVETIKWCMKKSLVQQGLTALEETIISYIGVSYGFDEAAITNETVRENNISRAINCLQIKYEEVHRNKELAERSSDTGQLIRDMAIQKYESEIKMLAHNPKNNGKSFIQAQYIDAGKNIIKQAPLELAVLKKQVADTRNDINHFGMRCHPKDTVVFFGALEAYLKKFEELTTGCRLDMPKESPLIEVQKAFTHAGFFHADDVFSTALLRILNPDIVIERGNMVPDNYDGLVFDIGGGEFDHHQKEKRVRENGIPYAAFGLLWDRYGSLLLNEEDCEEFDLEFIQPLDLSDNEGVFCQLASCIAEFNPTWLEETEDVDRCFWEAVEQAETMLNRKFTYFKAKRMAYEELDKRIAQAEDGILVLEKAMQWKGKLEESPIVYVIFPSLRGGYMVQAVEKPNTDRVLKQPFPQEWRGEPKEKLVSLTGIEGLEFCHNAGFICAVNNLEDAIKTAKLSKNM